MSEGLTMNELAEKNALLVSEVYTLQQKLDAMAAENDLARKAVQTFCDVVGANTDAICEEVGAEGVRAILAAMSATGNMPANDAYRSSVRAEVLNELCIAFVKHAEMAGLADHEKVTLKECTDAVLHCAEQLRSGAHDTADKAG